ncbi:MAG: nuclear transport factor 2 family protein [Candidatus Heimdallarchaeota archaeon]|nr:MAG: nuclear transport factor 2 family protein [Candidatus Heimdallarchaeota archaeon]
MTSLKDEIENLWKEYASSVVAGDIDRWISLWVDDGIQMPPDAPPNIGIEMIRTSAKNMMENMPASKMVINSEEVREVGDWGFSRGNYWFETGPEGETVRVNGKFLTIWEKQDDGSWKIARDIFNFNAPLQ